MSTLEICFWAAAATVAYTYVGYPFLIAVAARLTSGPDAIPNRGIQSPRFQGSVSIVMCVHNEEQRVAAKLRNLTDVLATSERESEIIVVSDGSTDATLEVTQPFAKAGVRVIALAEKQGKAAAQSLGAAEAKHDILVFCDVRQRWATDALERLLQHFSDPRVGGVSGELMVEPTAGVMAGVGFYWRYEKWIRRNESQVHSLTGVTGAICAVRRCLFTPMPTGTLLDDVFWPMCVVMKGYRVIHDRDACAYDAFPQQPGGEFVRKLRTLSGNYQLLARLPAVTIPWRNPIWFQFVSHKLLRLVVPWLLIVMLACSALLDVKLYRGLLGAQIAAYALGIAGFLPVIGNNSRLASAAASFLVLNAAAWLSFWVWLTGRGANSWRKVHYGDVKLGNCD